MSIERMPEEIIQKEVSRVPEKESVELVLGRAVSNMGDLVHAVDGKTRKYFEGLKENFEGALGWLEAQKGKATRVVLAGTLVGQLATACSPRTVDAKDILSLTPAETQEYIPEPAETEVLPTITVTPEPSLTPTAKPTEAPTPERPEELKEVGSSKDTSWIDEYSKNYSDELWSAINLGEFKEEEKALEEMVKKEKELFYPQTPGTEGASLTFVYLEDPETGDVTVGLASLDYFNKFIFLPINFDKSKGLDVEFATTLEDDSGPLFLTVKADEESVQKGEMQARFGNTTLALIDGRLSRINSEGEVIAVIGVKQETKEARWVRPLCKDYSNPENYTPITIEEIQNGQILFDEEIQAEPFPEDVEFPASYKFQESDFAGSVIALDEKGHWNLDYFKNVFFYKIEGVSLNTSNGEQKPYVMTQQFYQKNNTPGFVKILQTALTSDFSILLEIFKGDDQVVLPQYTIKNINKFSEVVNYRKKIFDTQVTDSEIIKDYWVEYFSTGQLPTELSKIIFLASSRTQR